MRTRRLIGGVRRARVVAIAMLLVTVPASASSARARSESTPRAATTPFADSPSVADARGQVGEIREAIETGRLADVLQASGIGGTFAPDTVGTTNAPSSPVAGLGDTDILQPIADLSAAIDAASRLVRSVLPPEMSMHRMRRASMTEARKRSAPRDILGPDGHEAFDRAAAIVATAIDSAIPQLLAQPAEVPSGRDVAGCDVVDQAPDLCVAGAGDNVITQDYALVIDLGGADLHEHSAGGAEPFTNGLPVAVTIDLDGNDRYAAEMPIGSGAGVVQGAGWLGVGFLVDVSGNDSYLVENEQAWGIAYGQGMGEHGFGLLADHRGNDTYELTTTGAAGQFAKGQGRAANGAGILLDGQGDDRYSIQATGTDFWVNPQGTKTYPPGAEASGLGMSVMGAFRTHDHFPYVNIGTGVTIRTSFGLLADGEGNDTLDLNATVADPENDWHYNGTLQYLPWGAARGVGFGAEGATGLAVLGKGDTEASLTTTGRAPMSVLGTVGLGSGYSGSNGILSDPGGADVWQLTADNAVERRATQLQDCVCPPPGVSSAYSTRIDGMGSGNFFANGLMDDAAGDDRYLVSATSLVETELRDERADENAKQAGALASSGAVTVVVQGAGVEGGAGELLDEGGNDRYEVVASNEARSTASRHGNAPQPTATSIVKDATVVAQGSARTLGQGTFTDHGGSDAYLASSSTAAEADPPTTVEVGTPTAGVLGAVDSESRATFIDRDEGQPDQFTASPAVAACTGVRGQGHWVDCGGAGVGLMA